MKRSRVIGLVGLLSLSAVACTAASDESDSSEQAVSQLQVLFSDARRLDLSDLTRVSVGFASDQLNDALAGNGVSARVERPTVYAATAAPNAVLPDNSEIKALDAIVSGLAARFGESELGTRVNKARLDHLSSGRDKYFVESGFSVRAGLNHGWGFDAGGLVDGMGVSLGFEANAELSSRVIVAAKDDDIQGVLSAPLGALKSMRGFVIPRGVDDIRAMKPGEMFALRGQGKLGANFGVGAPILVAEPTAGLTYRIVASAGVSGVIGGQLDVQLVRLPGDEVVVDVGVENGRGVSFHAAIRDGWGVKAICDDGQPCLRPLSVAGRSLDLQSVVEKAIEKRINQYLTFKIEGSVGQASSRVSISRFKFALDKGNADETTRALEQLLKFDLRLAQALYNRDLDQAEPAVVNELDAVRAATTSTRNFGFEVWGMNVYQHAVVERQGSFVVQTPDGARAVLFDHLEKNGGWFQTRHGFKRTGIAAATLDARDPSKFRSEANLFLSLGAGDEHVDDDMLTDNLDATLLAIGGKDVVEAVDRFGNEMERLTWSSCQLQSDTSQPSTSFDACVGSLVEGAQMKGLQQQGLQAVEQVIRPLPDDFKGVVRAAAKLRLTLQAAGPHSAEAMHGPKMIYTLDTRLDDRALAAVASKSKVEYRAALREYLTAVFAYRRDVGHSKDRNAVRAEVDALWSGKMDRMANRFEERAAAYARIAETEAQLPRLLSGKRFISFPIGVRFDVERGQVPGLENVVAHSTSHDRALAAAALFDGLKDDASTLDVSDEGMPGVLPLWTEQAAAFPLLALAPKESVEIGMVVQVAIPKNGWIVPLNGGAERYRKAGLEPASASARGAQASTIRGGLFDIDAIVRSN